MTGIIGNLRDTDREGAVPIADAGGFNLYNILAAAAAGVALELPLEAILRGIEGHKQVPGRLERVENDRGVALLVDYAHTGDACKMCCEPSVSLRRPGSSRSLAAGRPRLGKRPIMGEIRGAE